MKKTKSVFILIDSSENVQTFSNLKILCDTMQKNTEGFPSYWTLARNDKYDFKGKAFIELRTKTNELFKLVESGIIYPPKQDKKGSKLLENKKKGQT